MHSLIHHDLASTLDTEARGPEGMFPRPSRRATSRRPAQLVAAGLGVLAAVVIVGAASAPPARAVAGAAVEGNAAAPYIAYTRGQRIACRVTAENAGGSWTVFSRSVPG